MMTILATHALLAVGALFALGAPPAVAPGGVAEAAPDPGRPAADTLLRVLRGARLDLEASVSASRIEIGVWDRDEVEILTPEPVRVSEEGGLVRVGSALGGSPLRPSSYQVRLPSWMPVRVQAIQASVVVEGAGADVSIRTVRGSVRVSGGDGRVSASSVEGAVTIEGARGMIEATSVNQGVRVSDANGQVHAEAVNGNVRLERVQASDVVASTVNGRIDFDGPIRDDGSYRFSSHNGRVTITVQEGANATVSVSTYNGNFATDFPVSITGMGSDRRFTFVLGTGSARIDASSFNGNVELRRPGQPPSGR